MGTDERVRAESQHGVDEANEAFARIEQVKRFTLLDHNPVAGGGRADPTLKVKRPVVYSRYRPLFDALYD